MKIVSSQVEHGLDLLSARFLSVLTEVSRIRIEWFRSRAMWILTLRISSRASIVRYAGKTSFALIILSIVRLRSSPVNGGWKRRIEWVSEERCRSLPSRLTCRTSEHRTTTCKQKSSGCEPGVGSETNQSTDLPWPLRVRISGAMYSMVPQNVLVCPPS